MSLSEVAGLAKSFGGVVALRDASLAVEAGEAHALMGENGAGKSTLIKILAGAVAADRGEIALDGAPVAIGSAREAHRLGLRFVHQELNVAPRLSVAENLFLGRDHPRRWGGLVDWRRLNARAREALVALGIADIAPDAILGRLPFSERMIVKIAAAFAEDSSGPGHVFVMDEPTAALSDRESERLFTIIGELKRRGCAVIYVSHRIEETLRICERITVLRDGVSQPPLVSSRTTRAELIERMTGRTDIEAPAPPRDAGGGRVALSLNRLSGERLNDVSFELREGEILGLAGIGDSGGDRLLRALMGEARGGAVSLGGRDIRLRNPAESWRRGFAYVPRERRAEGLMLSHDIASNVSLPHLRRLSRFGWALNRRAERREADEVGRRVRLRATGPRQRVWRLSGGNQQKVMFARAVLSAPRILLLDEPTRGVDIAAKFDIHALLRGLAAGGAAMIVASSDHEELLALCARIAILIDGRIDRIVPAAGLTPARLLELCYGDRAA